MLIYTKEELTVNRISAIDNISMEKHCEITAIEIKQPNVIILCMYRFPNSQLDIFETLQKMCDIIFYQNKPIFISGNYNINMLSSEQVSVEFSNIIKSYGLVF